MSEREWRPAISVVVPALNEAANLPPTIRELARVLTPLAVPFETIVVDDGSTDDTAEVCRNLVASHPWMRVVSHARNEGYGRAMWTGINSSVHDVIVLIGADLQYDFDELPRLVSLTAEYDIVVGRRVHRAEPLVRRLNGRGWSALVRALCAVPIHDINSGFKAYRRSVFDGLHVQATGAGIDAEILARAHRRGARMIETPIVHRPRRAGKATGARPRVIARGLYELWRLAADLRA
jgi:glycosyltransferase involved in cell wall biosynthesis